MYEIKRVLVLLGCFYLGISSANILEFKKDCGKYNYIITIEHLTVSYETIIKHYYQKGDLPKKLFHQSEQGMFVEANCEKGKDNLDLFVFTEVCGGSACPDDIYGVFSLKQKKMLLNPKDWPNGNTEEIVKILGFEPDVSYFEAPKFCCVDQQADYFHPDVLTNHANKT